MSGGEKKTVAAWPWDDDDREEGLLTQVSEEHRGYYSVTSSNGWSCGVSAEYGVVPKVGDRFVTWGSIGRPIRGQAVNQQVLFYRTPDEQTIENQKAAEKHQAERIGEYESKRAEYDARVLALPEPLRARVEAFRSFGGDAWRWEFESYELMCCEQAAALAGRVSSTAKLRRFSRLSYKAQKRMFPEMDGGHSGNSWGMVQRLAHYLLERPASLVEEHGALCPLVGCKDYGCFSVRNQ